MLVPLWVVVLCSKLTVHRCYNCKLTVHRCNYPILYYVAPCWPGAMCARSDVGPTGRCCVFVGKLPLD
eukprot:jgi/Botrbrau1/23420/Bobra.0051s0063.1